MFNIFTPVELIIKLENLVYKIVSWTHWYNYQLFVCTLIIRCFFWKNNYPLTSPEVRSFVLGNSEIKYWSSYSCRSRIHLVSLKYVGSLAQRITVKWRDQALILKIKSNHIQGRAKGGPRAPLRVPPWEAEGGASMGVALLILHLLAFPFLRSGTVVYLGGQ